MRFVEHNTETDKTATDSALRISSATAESLVLYERAALNIRRQIGPGLHKIKNTHTAAATYRRQHNYAAFLFRIPMCTGRQRAYDPASLYRAAGVTAVADNRITRRPLSPLLHGY